MSGGDTRERKRPDVRKVVNLLHAIAKNNEELESKKKKQAIIVRSEETKLAEQKQPPSASKQKEYAAYHQLYKDLMKHPKEPVENIGLRCFETVYDLQWTLERIVSILELRAAFTEKWFGGSYDAGHVYHMRTLIDAMSLLYMRHLEIGLAMSDDDRRYLGGLVDAWQTRSFRGVRSKRKQSTRQMSRT